ncbi:AraC family transcriptional regulator (plasmid) [Agrobacterium tumefaciens]|uniref:AraC family transcriptional regulator n=1 Tax=Agrobacterium tumefaciens TaxID=358 RepID=A0AAJ4TDA9_AGRTU|nr:AraC family transcriptional regulator [Agrobacterium tumefaciens]
MATNTLPDFNSADEVNQSLTALSSGFSRWAPLEGETETAVPGLRLCRYSAPSVPSAALYGAHLSIVVQGRKRVVLAEEVFEYGASHFLISSLGLPVVTKVQEATPQQPFLSLLVDIDLATVRQIIIDMDVPRVATRVPARAIGVGPVTYDLLDAVFRLARLIDQPKDIAILAEQIRKEVFYRLILSEQGRRLCQIAFAETQGFQIGRVVSLLKEKFREPVSVEQLVSVAGMAVSTFHHHFREITGFSPLQYQKHLRLHEARRLMLGERFDAGTAALAVGYESQSQFTREYRRMFGKSPKQDVKLLRD